MTFYFLEILLHNGWSNEIGECNYFKTLEEAEEIIQSLEQEVRRREECIYFEWRILDNKNRVIKLIKNKYVGHGDD